MCDLDMNHTHYLLLDDKRGAGSEWKNMHSGQKINCRADLILDLRSEIEEESTFIWNPPTITNKLTPAIAIIVEKTANLFSKINDLSTEEQTELIVDIAEDLKAVLLADIGKATSERKSISHLREASRQANVLKTNVDKFQELLSPSKCQTSFNERKQLAEAMMIMANKLHTGDKRIENADR
ncbi:unnamed protein product [Didymodactylos carnosus]|uniref:Uncharacterized protein n=3 Tax=Didymodactylos carnosus TaxID=1234261 RepID=A0A814SFE6_9BILA|nr:unnamed protein product [Didymodactylos carnosus]CAF3910092.1 unnamed protein product [Didymodactylos carnosus]